MKSAIVNIGTIVTGDWRKPFAKGDSVMMSNGKIRKVGTLSSTELNSCEIVVDANKTTLCPGLIDSQVHITFGDYTPRQKTIGFIESYLHGGVTSCLSASEVHVPGRPSDPEGVKALALAAFKCFENYRPGGARVYGGCIILERPDLIKGLVEAHGARDTTARQAALAELEALKSRPSQYNPGSEIPEKSWFYRLVKWYCFNDFGTYSEHFRPENWQPTTPIGDTAPETALVQVDLPARSDAR